jgi:hypothetical protein
MRRKRKGQSQHLCPLCSEAAGAQQCDRHIAYLSSGLPSRAPRDGEKLLRKTLQPI